MMILKVTKNKGFTLSLEDTIFEKPQGGSNCYLTFGDFVVRKLFFTTKLLVKRERQKIKKIPHNILEKIISQII